MRPLRLGAGLAAVAISAGVLAGCAAGDASAPVPDAGVTAVDLAALDAAVDARLKPKGPTQAGGVVDRVVDGDTVHVLVDGQDITVRMIGINTPETVKPGSPVECFGPESSEFAKAALTGKRVTLEYDATQGRTDQYGRTLAYVWVERPGGGLRLFNLASVAGGYAFERQYGPTPYAWKKQFAAAQRSARDASRGLWGACPRS